VPSRGLKTGIIATVCTGVLGVAGVGAYNLYSGVQKSGSGGTPAAHTAAAPVNTTPPSPAEVSTTAADFLTAWAAGDTAGAAKLTDSVTTATSALTAYKTQARVTSLTITKGVPVGTKVPFTVNATLTYPGLPATPWTYRGSLAVARDAQGKPAVKWAPSVLYPNLTAGDTLVTGPAKTPDVKVVDHNGKPLDATTYPSLTEILKQLKSRYAPLLHTGTPGIETYILGADGKQTTTLDVLHKGVSATLKTTLDAGLQAIAEKSVKKAKGTAAGVTALNTTTGGILAVAFSPTAGTDQALSDLQAPGSTFKIITSTALFNAGLSPSTSSPCKSPDNIDNGKMYTNVSGDNPKATLLWDFELSCNTGFIKQVNSIKPTTLADTAARYYGIGTPWYVGTSTADASVPVATGDALTSAMIGQGHDLMTPLSMASIAATVREGVFHQPTLLQDTSIIAKRTQIPTTPLPPTVQQYLQLMMHGVVTSGTARPAMVGLTGKLGAKTGSAEAGNAQPNGWFTAYRNHVSAAGMVLQGGHGVDSAGPIVAALLAASS
jgi:hypothetical protein